MKRGRPLSGHHRKPWANRYYLRRNAGVIYNTHAFSMTHRLHTAVVWSGCRPPSLWSGGSIGTSSPSKAAGGLRNSTDAQLALSFYDAYYQLLPPYSLLPRRVSTG